MFNMNSCNISKKLLLICENTVLYLVATRSYIPHASIDLEPSRDVIGPGQGVHSVAPLAE